MNIVRKLLPWIGAALAIAALYVVWVGLGRQFAIPRMKAREARSYEIPGEMGRPGLGILHFYASPGVLVEGERASVCYGVRNARAVRIEPPVEELKPSLNRCFSVTPERTTTYTLIAEAEDGANVAASFTLQVGPAPPAILFVALSGMEVKRGEPLTVCYGVKHATSARLEPVGLALRPVEKTCVKLFPVRTTQFTLLASREGARTDRERFQVKVR